ncbi:OadG-related small transporter subunit [Latilactobacillus fuchuensis]|jgi:Na+-transporting methylmalonyl-CoA/oxaloacetate decarboxylase gamma subunit|uniref:Oxaloacetate decarboxylase, gamma chain family protein n=1 Tax=Latilactobacillus fuchuensis TaxID=164393 RepID=A0A2N9DY91_9LACO|nr:OadG-related small transporter subunit [Latilactobacillus fuchuensis]SPC40102.1 conserved hypothetical protein [Latilactobacillus fuchuensis]
MWTNLETAFELMLFGMGGVFLVLFVLFLTAKLLIKFLPVK